MIVDSHNLRYLEFRWILQDTSVDLQQFYGKEVNVYFVHWGKFIVDDGINKIETTQKEMRIKRLTKRNNPEYFL